MPLYISAHYTHLRTAQKQMENPSSISDADATVGGLLLLANFALMDLFPRPFGTTTSTISAPALLLDRTIIHRFAANGSTHSSSNSIVAALSAENTYFTWQQ